MNFQNYGTRSKSTRDQNQTAFKIQSPNSRNAYRSRVKVRGISDSEI